MGSSVTIHPPKTPCTKGSHGIAKATIPNICKMPGPPAPFVPAPLPNIGKSELSPQGYSTTVKIEGDTVAIRGATFESMGDMASKGTGGGLLSANCHGPTKFIAPGSLTVKIEGKSVHLLSDSMLNNCGPGGSPPNTGATMMGLDQSSLSVVERCEEVRKEAKRVADEERAKPGSERANKVSVLQTKDGTMVPGRNGGGNIPSVQKSAESYRPNEFNCACAELNSISKAINQGLVVKGGVIVTLKVTGHGPSAPQHGTKKPACSVCQMVLMEYEITEC